MALLAGSEDVLFGQTRAGVAYREHVVVSVAVVAGGDVGGHVRPPEGHRLAVVGLPVMGEPVLVAAAAALVAEGLKVRAGGLFDLVGRVAVRADRAARVVLGQQLPVDALVVDLPRCRRGTARRSWRCWRGWCARLSSTLRLMSCTPWQSLQDGATISPICSRAWPWMLSRYCAAAWELVMLILVGQALVAVAFAAGLREVELEHRANRSA